MAANSVKDTTVYKKAFTLTMEIFQISKQFPAEEKYSLTDEIRRSFKSVCICLLEAYRKKICQAHYVAKVTDSDMENSETSGWLYFAVACKYISNEQCQHLIDQNAEVGKLLYHMITNPDKY